MAQCQAYANLLHDDLQRVDDATANVERLCRKLGDFGAVMKGIRP